MTIHFMRGGEWWLWARNEPEDTIKFLHVHVLGLSISAYWGRDERDVSSEVWNEIEKTPSL